MKGTYKQVDFKSKEFYQILEVINEVLAKNRISPIIPRDLDIRKSNYNRGVAGDSTIWRVTDAEYPQLMTPGIIEKLQVALLQDSRFAKYLDRNVKIITFGNPNYTKSNSNRKMASITILISSLSDNIISIADLNAVYHKDDAAIKKCLELVSRMFKRADDSRDDITRLGDFTDSLIYEPKLINASLAGINQLTLKHQTNVITLETDLETDFSGIVNGQPCQIEGKSTRTNYIYNDTDEDRDTFAKYFKKRLESGSLGSIHGADYVLFVVKPTGNVICVNTKNTTENWLAGNIGIIRGIGD